MPKIGDMVAIIPDPKDPNAKPQMKNIGAIFDGQNGKSFKLDMVPINWPGWGKVYPPNSRSGGVGGGRGRPYQPAQGYQQSYQQQAPQPPADDDLNDDIPW